MKLRFVPGILILAMLAAQPAIAQRGTLPEPPRITPPVGIDPGGVLPGQRQGAPIFTPPKIGEGSSGTASKVPAKPQQPKTAEPPAANPGAPAPASEEAAPSESAPESASPPTPRRPATSPLDGGVAPGIGAYSPGTMQAPASLGPPPGMHYGAAFDPAPPAGYGGFGAPAGGPMMGPPPTRGQGHSCDRCCTAPCCCDPYWFGAVGGLIMGRNDPNRAWLSAQKSNYANQIMNGADAAAPWTGGWEASFGWFSPNCGALQFTYWQLAPTEGFDQVYLPGDLVTPINLNDVFIDGVGADYFYDNAQEHRVWRFDEIYDIELNFLGLPATNVGRSLQISWLAGVRYFRFRDRLLFGAVHEGFEFGSDGGINEAYLDVAMGNNLVGGQVGAFANWLFGPRFGVFLFPRVGVYANYIDQHFQLYRGDGVSSIDIGTNKTVGALIGQVDLGVNYFFTPNWSVYVGYRVIVAGGVGLADAQIPAFLIDTPEIEAIESNGNLILQGATVGLLWRF